MLADINLAREIGFLRVQFVTRETPVWLQRRDEKLQKLFLHLQSKRKDEAQWWEAFRAPEGEAGVQEMLMTEGSGPIGISWPGYGWAKALNCILSLGVLWAETSE